MVCRIPVNMIESVTKSGNNLNNRDTENQNMKYNKQKDPEFDSHEVFSRILKEEQDKLK